MSATGRNRKSKSKVDLVVIDDDSSSVAPPSETSVKVEEEEQQGEAQEPAPPPPAAPPLPSDVAELQQELTKMKRQFDRACRAARQAELRADHAENLLENKRELASNRERAEESELEEKVADLQKQLEAARKRADNAFVLKVEAARERDQLRDEVAELKISTERQVRVLREKYAGLEAGESDLARENATLKKDLEEANDKKDEVTRKLSALREELHDANTTKVELARELSSLKRDLEEEANGRKGSSVSDSALQALKNELEGARRREVDAKAEFARENAALKDEIDQLRRKADDGIDKDELARENATLKEEIEQFIRKADDGIAGIGNDGLIRENAALKAEVDQLRKAIDDGSSKDQLIREIEAVKRELERERRKSDRATTEKVEGTVENDLLRRELDEMKEKEEARRARSSQQGGLVISEESELAEENAALKEELAKLKAAEDDADCSDDNYLAQENASLREQLNFARAQAEAANANQIETVRERDALKIRVNQLEQAQISLTVRNNTLQDALVVVKTIRPVQAETENLSNQVQALTAQVAFERATTEKLRASHTEMERRLEQAESRLKRTSQDVVIDPRRDPRLAGRRSESVEQQRPPSTSPWGEKRPKLDEGGRMQQLQPRDAQPHNHMQHPQSQPLQQPKNHEQPTHSVNRPQSQPLQQKPRDLQQPRDSVSQQPMQLQQPRVPPVQPQQQQPAPWLLVESNESAPVGEFATVGDLKNLYHLVQPGSRDAISIDKAAQHVRTALEKHSATMFMGSTFLPSQGESAHCDLCNVQLDKMAIISHFCSQEHADKMHARGACVSLPALMYWVRKMAPPKKKQ